MRDSPVGFSRRRDHLPRDGRPGTAKSRGRTDETTGIRRHNGTIQPRTQITKQTEPSCTAALLLGWAPYAVSSPGVSQRLPLPPSASVAPTADVVANCSGTFKRALAFGERIQRFLIINNSPTIEKIAKWWRTFRLLVSLIRSTCTRASGRDEIPKTFSEKMHEYRAIFGTSRYISPFKIQAI